MILPHISSSSEVDNGCKIIESRLKSDAGMTDVGTIPSYDLFFVRSFLQIPPHDGHFCRPANVPPVGSVEDLHLQVNAPCRAHK